MFLDVDIIYDEVKVIVDHFEDVLLTNNCHIDHLKEELEILFDHINRYVSKSSAEKCWPIIFRIGDNLGICNLIHILDICLVAPLSNAESDSLLTFEAYFFKRTSITETWHSRNSFTYRVRQRSEQRKVWRCCWNVFKRTPTRYNQEEKTSSARSCVPV